MHFLEQGEVAIAANSLHVPTHRVVENIPESSGPFYFHSPGERIAVHDDKFGFAHFEPGIIQPMEDQELWALAVYVDNPRKQRWMRDPNTGRDVDEERSYKVPASANRMSAIMKYGPGMNGFPPGDSNHGLIEITAFAERAAKSIGVGAFNAPFNKQICPVLFDYKHVPEELQKRVGEVGGLEVRRGFVLEAREFFASESFVKDANRELQSLYLRAISEILEGFEQYKYFANSYLNNADRQVQQGEKKGYDEREDRLMWLLNRQGIDTALTRALSASAGSGLTGEQLKDILSSVSSQNQGSTLTPELIAAIAGQAAAAAVAAMQAKPEKETKREKKTEDKPVAVKDDELI
jgi:hypothetical protein